MVLHCNTPNFHVTLCFVWIFGSSGCPTLLPSVCSTGNYNSAVVTASYALFAKVKGGNMFNRAPYAVLGYQFQHRKLFSEFKKITSEVKLETFKNNVIMTFWVIVSSPCLRWYVFCIQISKTKLFKARIYFRRNVSEMWHIKQYFFYYQSSFCGYGMWYTVREEHKLLNYKERAVTFISHRPCVNLFIYSLHSMGSFGINPI